MSVDPLERAVDNALIPQQSRLPRFEPGGQTVAHALDCEDCVRAVQASGDFGDAVKISQRHLEESVLCESVRVTDIETEQELAVVFADRVERVEEGSA